MCRKMRVWLLCGVGVAVLAAAGVGMYAVLGSHGADALCVSVNGVAITNEEIDTAYNQQKDGLTPVTREQVIEATVRNTVVRDYGRTQGIAVTDEELDAILESYRATGYYDEAVALYGEEGLRQGLYNHELFTRTRDMILQERVTVPPVTQADIQAMLEENGLGGMMLTDKHREDIVYTLTKTKREEAYNVFVDELVRTATIIYT